MFLTAAFLKRKHACAKQLALFKETFPDGVEVTPEACVAVADKFDWDWAAQNLLPEALRTEYQAKRKALWAGYQAKRNEHLTDFDAKAATLWAEYEAKVAQAFGELAVRRRSRRKMRTGQESMPLST